jgi:predicted transcriptional regulator with HTH domain
VNFKSDNNLNLNSDSGINGLKKRYNGIFGLIELTIIAVAYMASGVVVEKNIKALSFGWRNVS